LGIGAFEALIPRWC